MLTLKQMRYFDALATTLHFGRAAEASHVSQPALSAQIGQMEKHLGVKLVERAGGRTMLTGHGARLVPRIRAILAQVNALETEPRRRGVLEGLVRLGIIPTIAPYLVPTLVPGLRSAYPGIEIELKETITGNLVDDLKVGRLDAIVVALPIDEDGLSVRPLYRDRFLVAGPGDGRSLPASPMTQEDIDVSRLLLLEEGHCLRDQALKVCSAADGRRLVNFGATSMATLLQMVGHGMGLTLVPEIALEAEAWRREIRILRFEDPQPSRTVGLAWRPGSALNDDFEALADAISESAEAVMAAGRAKLGAHLDATPADRPRQTPG